MNMGDFQVSSSSDRASSSSSATTSGSSSSSNSNPFSISPNVWLIAEQRTQEILSKFEPILQSEKTRKSIIDYLQRLFRNYLGVEIFPFGSMPLKTYLPDGDIDITVLSSQNVEEALAKDVLGLLQSREQSPDGFEVRDVQFINAEVKLIKCLVQDIVVDISFNQFGGLCTLCFFEEVDRVIGRDHIFKRSVMLIKAWSYYESRILGAHHGLLSTYALETLVLYIFQLFHASLNGPLAVLYRFLDYFSKFDWDNYAVSLSGPVFRSSLPQIVVTTPLDDGEELLLSKEFLKNCIDILSMPQLGRETNSRPFLQKHLNIVDPLKENNNLGRSVCEGNFYRIRCAFKYGARKLGQILSMPGGGSHVRDVDRFFTNTLSSRASGQRRDVLDSLPTYGNEGPRFATLSERIRGIRISSTGPRDGLLGLRPTAYTLKDMYVGRRVERVVATKKPEILNSMLDLGGDYDSHFQSLHYVRWYNAVSSGEPFLPFSQSLPSLFRSMHPQNKTCQLVPNPHPTIISSTAMGAAEVPLPQHTGPSPAKKGRNLTSPTNGLLQTPPQSSGGSTTAMKEATKERSQEKQLEEEFPALPSRKPLPQPVAYSQDASLSRPPTSGVTNADAFSMPPPDKLEVGSSSENHLSSAAQSTLSKMTVHTYKLKDDDDFPPLDLAGR